MYVGVVALRNVTMMTRVDENWWHVTAYVNEMRAAKIGDPKMHNVMVMLNGSLIVDVKVNVMADVYVTWSNEV